MLPAASATAVVESHVAGLKKDSPPHIPSSSRQGAIRTVHIGVALLYIASYARHVQASLKRSERTLRATRELLMWRIHRVSVPCSPQMSLVGGTPQVVEGVCRTSTITPQRTSILLHPDGAPLEHPGAACPAPVRGGSAGSGYSPDQLLCYACPRYSMTNSCRTAPMTRSHCPPEDQRLRDGVLQPAVSLSATPFSCALSSWSSSLQSVVVEYLLVALVEVPSPCRPSDLCVARRQVVAPDHLRPLNSHSAPCNIQAVA